MGVMFTDTGAAKIKRAVNQVLGTPQDRTGNRTTSHPTDRSFWAILTSPDVTGLRWNFVRVHPTANQDRADFVIDRDLAYTIADSETAEEGYAREANGNRDTPTFSVVRLDFIGYDQDGLPSFLFQWVGPLDNNYLPPHDHRDNYNGGMAFSTYHPGTALPQQPWAI